ncbi:transmembrane and ubiquitin-like domain-containing protein 1 [Episyrphus balteatus]|uniref:transmembrane and ubiquitin-like domain-containing protein 1 n=1 Tax=Episyrphus balteatus TaxID=286459 RepID=UPI00248581E2|nr:transmembrane and ubiquitin-like domain-containing protein 1 [Episyrphus balteatus]
MRLFFEELLIGFELKNFLIALAVLFIVYLAWESTYVRDYRVQPNAVLIIENNRRLLVDIGGSSALNSGDLRPRTDWTLEPVVPDASTSSSVRPETSTENNTTTSNNIAQSEGTNSVQQIPEPPPSLEVVIEEVHDLASVRQQLNENVYRTLESFEEGISELLEDNSGPQEVIAAMDTSEGLRRRRLGFEQIEAEVAASSSSTQAASVDGGGGDSTDSPVNPEISSNEKKSEPVGNVEVGEDCLAKKESTPAEKNDEFRIKIKYLNDDMKLVKGTPNENIGDFKKRNFTLELSAQKFVRLVFNGHVLQPDSKTLQACGLFDNCVVHCLVHNRNPNAANQNQQQQTGRSSLGQVNTSNQQNNSTGDTNQPNNDVPLVGNFSNHEATSGHLVMMYGGIILVTLSLIFSWYCRIQYHVLFSWYSTLVLILVTILFSILVPLLFFIENNEVQQQTT